MKSFEGVEIIALKWYDNKPVHLVSSFADAYPTATVQRWDKKEKKSIQVQCPSAIMIYNKFIGGRGLNGLTYSTVQNKYQVQKVVSSHVLSLLRRYCGEFLAFVLERQ